MRSIQASRVAIAWVASLAAPLLLHAEDAARIYVYASRETEARSWMRVTSGGAVAAELKRGTYFAIDAAPGRIAIGSENAVPVVVEAEAGAETFVRLDWKYEVGRPPVAVFSKVRAGQARSEMKFLSYIPAKKIHSPRVQRESSVELPGPALKTRENR